MAWPNTRRHGRDGPVDTIYNALACRIANSSAFLSTHYNKPNVSILMMANKFFGKNLLRRNRCDSRCSLGCSAVAVLWRCVCERTGWPNGKTFRLFS